MVHDSRRGRGSEALLAAALVAGAKLAEAAKLAKMSERTASRRVSEPTFKALLAHAGEKLLRDAMYGVSGLMGKATVALSLLLDSPNEPVKLGAVKATFQAAAQLRELVELSAQVAELREQMVKLVTRLEPANRIT